MTLQPTSVAETVAKSETDPVPETVIPPETGPLAPPVQEELTLKSILPQAIEQSQITDDQTPVHEGTDHDYAAGNVVSETQKATLDCGCGATFTTPGDLDTHRQNNHGGGVVCRDCGLTLTTTPEIRAHADAHTTAAYKCIVSIHWG